MRIDNKICPSDLSSPVARLFDLASAKTLMIARRWKSSDGAPVVTAAGKYPQSGLDAVDAGVHVWQCPAVLDATGSEELLRVGREGTRQSMAEHVTHTGVHDHGFNNLATYGQLRRLLLEGRLPADEGELRFYELALKVSGAVQAARWTDLPDGRGYIYSFNGSHSLFIDTIRTLRICGLGASTWAYSTGRAGSGDQPPASRADPCGRFC